MQPARLGAARMCVASALLGLLVLAPPTRAQAVLETPQQANDRIRELSAAARVEPRDYIIGNGDLLDIEIFDVKELSRDVRVSQTEPIVRIICEQRGEPPRELFEALLEEVRSFA